MKRSLIAAAIALALSSAADARPRHVRTYAASPECNVTMPCEGVAPSPRGERIARKLGIGKARNRYTPTASIFEPGLVSRARAYLGETAAQVGVRRSQWCSAFLRKLTGASGVDDRAISWIRKPHVVASVGSIAVMRHHVGVVSGFDGRGNPILVSGNHGHRVGEGVYPRRRILAFVSPQ